MRVSLGVSVWLGKYGNTPEGAYKHCRNQACTQTSLPSGNPLRARGATAPGEPGEWAGGRPGGPPGVRGLVRWEEGCPGGLPRGFCEHPGPPRAAVESLPRCPQVQKVTFYLGNTTFFEDPQNAPRAPPGLSRGLQGVPKGSPRAPQGPPRESEWTPHDPRELPWVSPGGVPGGAKGSQRGTEGPQSSPEEAKRAQRGPRGGSEGQAKVSFPLGEYGNTPSVAALYCDLLPQSCLLTSSGRAIRP